MKSKHMPADKTSEDPQFLDKNGKAAIYGKAAGKRMKRGAVKRRLLDSSETYVTADSYH